MLHKEAHLELQFPAWGIQSKELGVFIIFLKLLKLAKCLRRISSNHNFVDIVASPLLLTFMPVYTKGSIYNIILWNRQVYADITLLTIHT